MRKEESEAVVPAVSAAAQTSARPPEAPEDNVEITVNSDDFNRCVLAAVPEEVKPVLQGVLARKPGSSLLAALLSPVMIAAAFLMLYWARPAPVERRIESEVDSTGLKQTDFPAVFRQADAHYKKKEYNACANNCREWVKILLKDPDMKQIRANGLLLDRFFNSVLLGGYPVNDPVRQEAIALSRNVCEIDRDTPQWWLFRFKLAAEPEFGREFSGDPEKRFAQAKQALAVWRSRPEHVKNFNREQSDYVEAGLCLELWCAHGPLCGWEMDDDCPVCLEARERAWEIVSAPHYHENSDFLELGKELLTMMRRKGKWLECYTIGGERYWLWRELDEKRKDIRDRLEALHRKGGKK